MASRKKAIGVAVGSAFVAGMTAAPMANAADNPFTLQSLQSGYMVASSHTGGKAPEAKCGGMKSSEAKCGMGMMDTDKDGRISKDEFMKSQEAMYASKDGDKKNYLKGKEAVFAAKDKNKDGFIDAAEEKAAAAAAPAAPKASEAKCGQGKCGAMPKK
jgi:uncharacterized low-complexity protein